METIEFLKGFVSGFFKNKSSLNVNIFYGSKSKDGSVTLTGEYDQLGTERCSAVTISTHGISQIKVKVNPDSAPEVSDEGFAFGKDGTLTIPGINSLADVYVKGTASEVVTYMTHQ